VAPALAGRVPAKPSSPRPSDTPPQPRRSRQLVVVSPSVHFLAFLLFLDIVVMVDPFFIPVKASARCDAVSPPCRAAIAAGDLAPPCLRPNHHEPRVPGELLATLDLSFSTLPQFRRRNAGAARARRPPSPWPCVRARAGRHTVAGFATVVCGPARV